MRYRAIITIDTELNIKETILRLDEFLKEYWGIETYYITNQENRILRNTAIFDTGMKTIKFFPLYYAFRKIEDHNYLQKNGYNTTPPKVELFSFIVKVGNIEVDFYNSFETNEREQQFYKIVENIKKVLEVPLPLVRLYIINRYSTKVMYKYRRNEAKVGFYLIPASDIRDFKNTESIFIHWCDFTYLRPFIEQAYPQQWENGESCFDNTSQNYIRKDEWEKILNNLKSYKTNNSKLSSFYNYIVKWVEKELMEANYISIYGNL